MKSSIQISAFARRERKAVAPKSAGTAPLIAPRLVSARTRCACGGPCPRCARAAARRATPGLLPAPIDSEASEREAATVARQVLAMPAPPRDPPAAPPSPPASGKNSSHHATAGMSSSRHQVAPVPRFRHQVTQPGAPPASRRSRFARQIRATASPSTALDAGLVLDDSALGWFEARFQTDFSAVRIHRGPVAGALAAQAHARAFAYGNHIVLGPSIPSADTAEGRGVLAHELTHAVQQAGVPSPYSGSHLSPQTLPRGPPSHPAGLQIVHPTATLGLQCLDLPSLDDVTGAVVDLGEGAWDTAVDAGGAVVDFAADGVEAVVDYFAPGLLAFLRGGVGGQLSDLFCSGLDSLVGALISPLAEIDFVSALENTFTSLTDEVRGLWSGLGAGASATVGALLRPLVDALAIYGDPIIQAMSDTADTADGIFSGLWDNIGVPVLDFLASAGGSVLAGFNGMIDWIVEKTEPLQSLAREAWTWLCQQFDLAWESTSGIRQWMEQTASQLWESFLEAVEPIQTPLMVAGGALLLLSPLGPIVILSQIIPPIYEKVVWLWNNWNTDDILVQAREMLANEILPGIISAAGGLVSAIASAASWLAGTTASLVSAFSGLLGVFGENHCLQAVNRVLDHISDQFDRLGVWAEGGFTGLGDAIGGVFEALIGIVEPILDFLVRLILAASNPPLLPIALTGAIWLLCPDELKPPVVNFVLDFILQFLRLAANFLIGLGPLVLIMKSAAIGFLRNVRGQADSLKIDASNKIANLMAGGGLSFVSGFAVGILEGLLDGILDPFRLIWMLVQFIARLCRSIGDYLAPMLFAADPRLGAAVGSFSATMRAGIPAPAPSATTPEPASPGAAPAAPGPDSALGPTATAPPTAEAGSPSAAPAPVGAGASPDDAAFAELMGSGPTLGDAQIVSSLTPGLAGELTASAGELDAAEAAGATGAEEEVRTEGASVGGLAGLLGGIWDAIIAGATGLGNSAAEALLGFIMLPDYQLGNKIGYVCGLILLEVIVAYFSGGVSVELKAAEPFIKAAIRFLDLGGEILGLLGRAVGRLRGPLLRGLSAAGEHLGRFRFLEPIIARCRRALEPLLRFGDEAAAAAGHTAGRADDVALHAADDVADAARAGRRADDVPGAARHADEAGGRTGREAATEAAEKPLAIVAAQAIIRANDPLDPPVAVLLAQLNGLRSRYAWIDGFRADPKGRGRYEMHMIASDTNLGMFDNHDETSFDLDGETVRFESTGSGLRERPVTVDIDEPLAVGAPGIPAADASTRAFDPMNRQFLESLFNQRTKHVGTDLGAVARPHGPLIGPRSSLVRDPNALFRRFGEVEELETVFNEAVRGVSRTGRATGSKADINRRIWELIRGERATTPDVAAAAARIRDAFAHHGMDPATRGFLPIPAPSALGPPPAHIPASVASAIAAPGEPLARPLRSEMEHHFSADLSHVRLHTGHAAANSARDINARAYAVDHHVVLGSGHETFNSSENRRLLAHELAHTLQAPALRPTHAISRPGDPAERAAEAAARTLPAAASAHARGARTSLVQRDEGDEAGKVPAQHPTSPVGYVRVNLSTGEVGFALVDQTLIKGTVTTDLKPGRYRLHPNYKERKWLIDGAAPGLQFTLNFGNRADPWMLSYHDPLPLEVGNASIDSLMADLTRPRWWEDATLSVPDGAPFFSMETDPHAFSGIQLYYTVGSLPFTSGVDGRTVFHRGPYIIAPNIVHHPDGPPTIGYYVVYRSKENVVVGDGWNEYIVGPDSIKTFLANLNAYVGAAGIPYMFGPPAPYQAESGKTMQRLIEGDVDAAYAAWKNSWSEAVQDPGWWAQVAMSFAGGPRGGTPRGGIPKAPGVVRPPPTPARPPLRVVASNPSVGVRPKVSGGGVNPPSATASMRGNLALKLETAPAPAVPAKPQLSLVPDPLPAPPPVAVTPKLGAGPTPGGLPHPATAAGSAALSTVHPKTAADPAVAAQPATTPQQNPAPQPQPQPQPQPAPDPEKKPEKKKPAQEIRLVLPSQKSIHAAHYASLIAQGRLMHVAGKDRDAHAQADRWDRILRPGGPNEIFPEIWQKFEALAETHDRDVPPARRLRPDWARGRLGVNMEVDHIVELQVAPKGEDAVWDDAWNYELLDAASNGSSGSRLKANITAERARLAALNPIWATADLVFNRLIVTPGPAGERWSEDEIQRGAHYHALMDMIEVGAPR